MTKSSLDLEKSRSEKEKSDIEKVISGKKKGMSEGEKAISVGDKSSLGKEMGALEAGNDRFWPDFRVTGAFADNSRAR